MFDLNLDVHVHCFDQRRVVFGVGPFVEADRPHRPNHARYKGVKQGETSMAFTMTDSQQTTVKVVAFTDKKGNPVAPTAPPAWLVDNTDLLTLTPAADGMSCLVVATGPLGDGVVSCKATTPSGDIAGSLDVKVVSGAPVSIVLAPDAPVEQP